jgi:hypothetical protein
MGEVFLLSVFLRLLLRLLRKIWISKVLHMLLLRDNANMATPPKDKNGKAAQAQKKLRLKERANATAKKAAPPKSFKMPLKSKELPAKERPKSSYPKPSSGAGKTLPAKPKMGRPIPAAGSGKKVALNKVAPRKKAY